MELKKIYVQYKDVIPYIIFGVLTTGVNIIVYWMMAHVFYLTVMVSTIIAWMLSVLFAYITNRRWVFNSSVDSISGIFKEMVSFFACRFVTGIIDWACMFIFVNLLHFQDVIIKIIANFIVIILNYLASKLVIFKQS